MCFISPLSHQSIHRKKYNDIVRKWFKHLRNAFAHNYIILEDGIYHFYDFYDEEGNHTQQTFYARITSLDDFKKLILEVKSKIKIK